MARRGAAIAAFAALALWGSPTALAAPGPTPAPSPTTGTQDGVTQTTLTPQSVVAPPGVTVHLTGSGFPSEGACVVGVELVPGDVRTSPCILQPPGAVDASFTVPLDATVGDHPIRVCVGDCGISTVAAGVVSEGAVLATATLTVPGPILQPAQPTGARPGRTVVVVGSGWSPGGTCTVTLGGVDVGADCAVDQSGGLRATFAVPAEASAGSTRIVVSNRFPGGIDAAPARPVQAQGVPFRVLLVTVTTSPTAKASTSETGQATAASSGISLTAALTWSVLGLALVALLLLAVRAVRNRRPRPPPDARLTVTARPGPWLSPQLQRPAVGLHHVLRIETVVYETSTATLERQP